MGGDPHGNPFQNSFPHLSDEMISNVNLVERPDEYYTGVGYGGMSESRQKLDDLERMALEALDEI